MVTGRIILSSPEYSPISSSVSERALLMSSRFQLPAATGIGDEDQRGPHPALAIERSADQCLACAARQHHHTRTALPERLRGHLLGVAQVPVLLVRG